MVYKTIIKSYSENRLRENTSQYQELDTCIFNYEMSINKFIIDSSYKDTLQHYISYPLSTPSSKKR